MIFCTGNMIYELMVFKFSLLRNWAVHFDETVHVYTELCHIENGFKFWRHFNWDAVYKQQFTVTDFKILIPRSSTV